MSDLGEYLGRKTCAHVMENVGGNVGTAFRNGLFVYDARHGNVPMWGGYRMNFVDGGACIRIKLSDGNDAVASLKKKLPEKFDIPKKYRDVISSVDVKSEEDGLYIDLYIKSRSDGSGRTTNDERIFHSVYQVGVKPALRAIFELHEKR